MGPPAPVKRVMPKGPCYRLTVGRTAKWMVFEQDLWGKDLLARLDGLRAVLAANEKAPGGTMCPRCVGKMFIMSVGKCTQCGRGTSSGAHKLCKACSAKQAKCQACGRLSLAPRPRPWTA